MDDDDKSGGFQKIGNLAKDISKSARSSASQSRKKPSGSATMQPATTGDSSTGTLVSATGSGRLGSSSPFQVNRQLLVSLLPALKLLPIWEPGEEMVRGYEVMGKRKTGLKTLRASMAPAGEKELSMALARCEALTKRRTRGNEDKLAAAAYIEELRLIPGDMALWALAEWPRQSTWFPSLHDLLDLVRRPLRERRLMLEALQSDEADPVKTIVSKPVTPKQIDAIKKKHGLEPNLAAKARAAPKPSPQDEAAHLERVKGMDGLDRDERQAYWMKAMGS